MKKILGLLAAVLMLAACGNQNKKETEMKKYLVIYYSQTGVTRQVALEIARQLNADTLSLQVENPYSGTFDETVARVQNERETGELPRLKPIDVDLSAYETIFLGYPIWFGTYAPPIAALVEQEDFEGKRIVPFCTFGSGGRVNSRDDLTAALPLADVTEAYGVRTVRVDKAPAEVKRFLSENGFLEGETVKLPDFSPQQPVTDEEVALFNAACGSYPFPLGTPVSAGSRTTDQGTDYEFVAESQDSDGNTSTMTIYISVGKEEGAVPEFTEVVR